MDKLEAVLKENLNKLTKEELVELILKEITDNSFDMNSYLRNNLAK